MVDAGASDKLVDLQPGAASQVAALLLKSSVHASELSFKASDGTTDSTAVTLDEPQFFAGGGIALFGVAPKQLKFTNTSTDKPATIEIFVGRDATP